jgi:hypothetical protein
MDKENEKAIKYLQKKQNEQSLYPQTQNHYTGA